MYSCCRNKIFHLQVQVIYAIVSLVMYKWTSDIQPMSTKAKREFVFSQVTQYLCRQVLTSQILESVAMPSMMVQSYFPCLFIIFSSKFVTL